MSSEYQTSTCAYPQPTTPSGAPTGLPPPPSPAVSVVDVKPPIETVAAVAAAAAAAAITTTTTTPQSHPPATPTITTIDITTPPQQYHQHQPSHSNPYHQQQQQQQQQPVQHQDITGGTPQPEASPLLLSLSSSSSPTPSSVSTSPLSLLQPMYSEPAAPPPNSSNHHHHQHQHSSHQHNQHPHPHHHHQQQQQQHQHAAMYPHHHHNMRQHHSLAAAMQQHNMPPHHHNHPHSQVQQSQPQPPQPPPPSAAAPPAQQPDNTVRKERKKRICLTLQEKSKIITELQQGAQMNGLAEKYEVSLMTIYSIRKHAAEIISAVGSSYVGLNDQKKVMRAGEFAQMEERLFQWFNEQRQRDAPVSGELLKAQARLYFEQCRSSPDDVFYASEGWLQNFKNRFGIRLACGEANGGGGGGGGGANGSNAMPQMMKMHASPDSATVVPNSDPLKYRMNEILRELNLSNDQQQQLLITGEEVSMNRDWSDDDARNAQTQNGDHFINPAQFLDDTESEHDPNADASRQSSTRQNSIQPLEVRPAGSGGGGTGSNLSLRNINSLKRSSFSSEMPKLYNPKLKMSRHNNHNSHGNAGANLSHHQQQQHSNNHHMHHNQSDSFAMPAQRSMSASTHQSSDKFNAFGMFLTSSLLDMPENRALALIEKFTNEIVRAFIEKPASSVVGGGGSGSGGAGGGGANANVTAPNAADDDCDDDTPVSANSSSIVEENNV